AEIHDVMTSFSRSLRRFVQSQELAEDRAINRRLQQAQRTALELAEHVAPYARTELELALSSDPTSSAAALSLHNPADAQTAEDVTTRRAEPIDLANLRHLARLSEIDLKELRHNVDDAVRLRGAVTIGEVLALHPATQGVASVIGLLVL